MSFYLRNWRKPLLLRGLPLLLLSVCATGARTAQAQPRSPYLQSVTQTSAWVLWKTASSMQSVATLQSLSGDALKAAPTAGSFHKAWFGGLKPNTWYLYSVLTDNGTFHGKLRTAPAATGPRVAFAVWGDSGMANPAQRRVAAQIAHFKPDFLVHTGDLIYPDGAAEGLDPKFFQIYQPMLSHTPFWGALGNHDVMTEGGRPWLDNFVLPHNGPAGVSPGREYSFDWGPAHFAVLDADSGSQTMKSVIAPWLVRDLQISKATWKFVVFHQPPFDDGLHGDDLRVKQYLVPAFEAGGANVVLNGHDHNYQRWAPIHGITYIVSGGGGGPLYARKTHRPGCVVFDNSDWSFTAIVITGRRLHLRQMSSHGKVLDDWTINR